METPRLILTRFTSDHLEGYYRIWSSKEATQWRYSSSLFIQKQRTGKLI